MSDSSNDGRKRSPIPMERESDSPDESGGWIAGLVPQRLGLAALTVEVHAPATIRMGEPTAFYVVVRNRIPFPVVVSTATSRLWGWAVDGIDEGDTRGFTPPDTGRQVKFGGRERKVFRGTWDGRICEQRNDEPVWTDAPGEHTIRGYFAVDDDETHGLAAEAEVFVTTENE